MFSIDGRPSSRSSSQHAPPSGSTRTGNGQALPPLDPADAPAPPRAGGVIERGEAAHPIRASLGAADLEIVGDVVGEAVQRGVAGQAEDEVDSVVLAPVDRLAAAVMAVAAEGQPGARPVAADAPGQVLEKDADLDARRRLARAHENRHRLSALNMVDVHRQEAAGVVVGVEQRQLLVAVNPVAGVVDVSSVIAGGGDAKERQKMSTRAAVMRPASVRDGAFLSLLMVGWEH